MRSFSNHQESFSLISGYVWLLILTLQFSVSVDISSRVTHRLPTCTGRKHKVGYTDQVLIGIPILEN